MTNMHDEGAFAFVTVPIRFQNTMTNMYDEGAFAFVAVPIRFQHTSLR